MEDTDQEQTPMICALKRIDGVRLRRITINEGKIN